MHRAIVALGSIAQKELPMHRNIGMEIVLVTEGRLRWIVDGRAEDVPAGSVFFTLPWQAHGGQYAHEPGNRIHFVQFRLDKPHAVAVKTFRFHPSLRFPANEARHISAVFTGAERHAWPASDDLRWLLLTFIRRLEQRADRLYVQGLFHCVVAELAAVVSGSHKPARPTDAREQRVQAFLDRLPDRCGEPWTLARMCHECRLGKTRLTTVVQRLTGDSPVAYWRRLCIAKAEQLLRDTDATVTEVAFRCGFSSSQLFSRVFRKYTNRTPSQHRRQYRQPGPVAVLEWSEEDERQRLRAIRKGEWV